MHKSEFSGLTWVTVTVAYIATYSMTNGFFEPIESILAPNLPSNVSLMFIPHGVRVLTFYFFGLWGFLYLAPVACLMWALEVYGQQHVSFLPLGILFSLIACHVGVEISRKLLKSSKGSDAFSFNWRQLLVAGSLGSALNSLGLTWLYNSSFEMITFAGYLVGDVAGQFFMMLIIIVFFKLARACNGIK